jgi:hypothetical protein
VSVDCSGGVVGGDENGDLSWRYLEGGEVRRARIWRTWIRDMLYIALLYLRWTRLGILEVW